MKYKIEIHTNFQKQFKKLDKPVQVMIYSWIKKNLVNTDDPRQHGKALTGNKSGYWRYRVGNYRIIAEINGDEMILYLITIAHRKDVYKL